MSGLGASYKGLKFLTRTLRNLHREDLQAIRTKFTPWNGSGAFRPSQRGVLPTNLIFARRGERNPISVEFSPTMKHLQGDANTIPRSASAIRSQFGKNTLLALLFLVDKRMTKQRRKKLLIFIFRNINIIIARRAKIKNIEIFFQYTCVQHTQFIHLCFIEMI